MDGGGFLLCSIQDSHRYVFCAVNILSYIPTTATTATVRKLDDQPGRQSWAKKPIADKSKRIEQ